MHRIGDERKQNKICENNKYYTNLVLDLIMDRQIFEVVQNSR